MSELWVQHAWRAAVCRRCGNVTQRFITGGNGAPPSNALPCVIPGEGLAFFDHAAHLLPHFNHDVVRHGL
jgi:hypothetical protein